MTARSRALAAAKAEGKLVLVGQPSPAMRNEIVPAFTKKYGKPPENHAWIDYVTLKLLAEAINTTKSTDSAELIGYFEKQTQFDIMKGRKAYFRNWDHQLVQEAYPFTVKPKNEMKDKWDMLVLGDCVVEKPVAR